MDPETAWKQFEALKKEAGAAYAVMTAILATLPVPMRLPARQHENPPLVLRSLARAWELAGWENLEPQTTERLRAMITAWITAYELSVLAQGWGPAPWRLRAIDAALRNCREHAAWLARYRRWVPYTEP